MTMSLVWLRFLRCWTNGVKQGSGFVDGRIFFSAPVSSTYVSPLFTSIVPLDSPKSKLIFIFFNKHTYIYTCMIASIWTQTDLETNRIERYKIKSYKLEEIQLKFWSISICVYISTIHPCWTPPGSLYAPTMTNINSGFFRPLSQIVVWSLHRFFRSCRVCLMWTRAEHERTIGDDVVRLLRFEGTRPASSTQQWIATSLLIRSSKSD